MNFRDTALCKCVLRGHLALAIFTRPRIDCHASLAEHPAKLPESGISRKSLMRKPHHLGSCTLKLGLIGRNIHYSGSPELHRGFLKEANLHGTYDLLPCEDLESLQPFWDAGFHGLNVTQPFKEKAADLCVELKDWGKTGIVNTLKRTESGYVGINTDALALLSVLSPTPQKALILGYGGVGKISHHVLKHLGCPLIHVAVRHPQESQLPWEEALKCLKEYDCIIQASSCPTWPGTLSFHDEQLVIDWQYQNTSFVSKATHAIDGFFLLKKQAELSFEEWKKIVF